MRKNLLGLLVLLISLNTISAKPRVIYGEDHRDDLKDVKIQSWRNLAASTAAQVANSKIYSNGESSLLSSKQLKDRGICSDERFANQPVVSRCSGFLVAPDLLVTAGHCVTSKEDCTNYSWVFDYNVNENTDEEMFDSGIFPTDTSNIYACDEVITTVLTSSNKDDYALVRLSRVVEDREPLKFRTEGKVPDDSKLLVIGHPSGLPSKIAGGAVVRNNSNSVYFQSNLDTFGGNSGSAVFNLESEVVEGILVRGEQDYITDWFSGGCQRVKKCADTGCRGEDITRITNITELMDLAEIYE